MFREDGFRPSDQRGFIHKSKLGRFVTGAVKTFVPAVAIGSKVLSTGRSLLRTKARATVPRTLTARSTLAGAEQKELGLQLKFPSDAQLTTSNVRQLHGGAPPPRRNGGTGFLGPRGGGCPEPLILSPEGNCIAPTSPRGAELFMGEATMGRYGAALIPGTKIIDRAVCLPGMQLGDDGLCYNKGAITNSQRMWPRGRRPLLTGGDMNAIAIASRAGGKLDRTTKRLRALGMMKALPKPRKAPAPHAHAKPVAAVSV